MPPLRAQNDRSEPIEHRSTMDYEEIADPTEMEDLEVSQNNPPREEAEDTRWYAINRYLLPVKISYFINNARIPYSDYLVLFYVSAGLSPSAAGFVNGLQHLGGMIAAPLFGLLADKHGYHRLITICLCLAALLAVCAQPILTTFFGNEENNFCPAKVNITDIDAKIETFKYDTPLFYTVLTSAFFASSFDGSIMGFIEADVLRRVKTSPRKATIGMQRIMASLGTTFGAMTYSVTVYLFPHGHVSCYVGLFITYSVLTLFLLINYYFLFKGVPIEREERRSSVPKKLWEYLKNIHNVFFLLTVLLNGTASAIIVSFLFLYLKHLNASTLLLGASISFNCISAIVIYTVSSHLIKFLGGPMKSMAVSSFAWSLRLVCLAYLGNPYIVLVIDIFHGFTFSLFRVASLEHIKNGTDPAIFSSVCGVANALSYSTSFLIANIAGGVLYETFGPKRLFFGMAAVCFSWSLIMTVYNFVMERIRNRAPPYRPFST